MEQKINENKNGKNGNHKNGNHKNGNHKRMVKKFEMKFKIDIKNLILYVLVGFLILSFFLSFSVPVTPLKEVPLSQVLTEVKDGKVKEITVEGDKLSVVYKDSSKVMSYKERGESLVKTFEASGINPKDAGINIKDMSTTEAWINILSTLLPTIFIAGLLLFMFRQAKGAQDSVFNFGTSRAKIFNKDNPKVTFDDVAGVDEAKKELEEVVDFLKNPKKYQALGARTPKGVLLIGPSGCGKTLLARAVAGQAGVPFFSMAGSEFMEMLVGVGSARARDLFSTAKKNAPCLPGETKVTLADGREFPIEEMFANKMVGEKVLSMVDGDKTEAAKIVAITRRRFNKLYEVRTLHWTVKATPNHEFPVLNNGEIVWKRADKLSKNDYVAYPLKLPTGGKHIFLLDLLPSETRVYLNGCSKSIKLGDWKDRDVSKINHLAIGRGGWTDSKLKKLPENLTRDLSYLAGLLYSDGNFSKTNRFNVNFINTNEDLHGKVKDIVRDNFGYLPRTFLDTNSKKGTFSNRKKCWVTHINNRLIRIILENLKGKLLSASDDLIAAFISGYFDGDGYVADEKSLPKIVISVWNEEENAFIRSLLHRLGIVAYGSSTVGNIEVTGKEAVEKLSGLITSCHSKKKERLSKLRLEGTKSSRLDGIPVGLLLKDVRHSMDVSQRDLDMGGKISDYEQGNHVPSRESLRQIIYKIEEIAKKKGMKNFSDEFMKLKNLVFGEIGFSKVLLAFGIKKTAYVYDLCLNDHHNFVANGLFVHNCIVFIDEIDAIGRQRGYGLMGGHDEREQTLNQILVEMDGFTPNEQVVVLSATNRPDVLDPALVRPGRFDRRVVVDMPDLEGRKAILKIHMKNKPFAAEVDWERVAKRTVGFSGADLENMLNEAAILAARLNKTLVDMSDLEEAATKVKMGPEKKRMQSDLDKKMTAYHEAGHAVVTFMNPRMDPVHRISIVSRGHALGYTLIPPEKDVLHETKTKMVEQISTMFGGRAAEEIVFNDITSGASNDIDQATQIAREMVVEFGMSDLGPINFGPNYGAYEWGKTWTEQPAISPDMQSKIDDEIKKLIDAGHERAVMILKKMRKQLDIVALELIKNETLDGEEFEKLMGVPRPKVES